MRKIVIHGPGSYNRLKLEEHPDPKPAPGEVLVGVRAIGVNFADVVVRMGLYESARKYVGWPITPGFEFAGEVIALGEGVRDLAAGDKVLGITRFGAYATRVCAPRHQIFRLPERFSLEQGAAFPAVFMTAYHSVFQSLRVRPGMTTLVHSAAGGMGTAILQMGKIAGWRQIGVVGSTHKIDVARSFGADEVIDASREDLWARAKTLSPGGFDVVFDGNGPSTMRQSFDHLAPVGKLVAYGFHSMFSKRGGLGQYLAVARNYFKVMRFNPLQMLNTNRSVIAFNVSFLFDRHDLLAEGMSDLLKWVDEGRITPPAVTLYDFARVAEAHKAIESGKTTGKLVLTV